MKRKTFPFETKELKDNGELTGYASVFDTVDYYRDVVRRGAFTDSIAAWKAKGRMPPLLWQHQAAVPLGPHLDMYEDDKGLYVHAQLLVDEVEKAREARALIKAKVISGMSIGFDIADGGSAYDAKANVFNLTKLDLWENSIATFPANPDAQVEEVKSILASGKLPPPSDFEGFLRDAGFTRREAKYIASNGYTSLRDAGLSRRDDEEHEETTAAKSMLAELSNYLQKGQAT
jgi:HK97 family phage prohead protease